MKKIQILALMVFLALFTACNFTEEIHLQEDGSGKLSIFFDGSELMEMAGEEMQKNNEKPVDSLIYFKDFLEAKKDSIAQLPEEEQAKLKKLEPFTLHMLMNPEEKLMKFDLSSEFKQIAEVNDAFNTFQEASALGPGSSADQPGPKPMENHSTEVNYSFEDGVFTRTAKILDEELFEQSLDSLQGADMFLSGSTYTLKYHFPRRVKSASIEEATYSADGKTLIYEVNFMDVIKDPKALDLKVELED
ncbi:hypothetical protein GTQ34_09960 [Muricauda sp. JGD-17]|uniref:Lipoprotein n=1 Tax=Flagellimonas ochracea TaxID=2696472 RepID=A0A964WY51_9FLAO|nr:hypothetical protein [Allomuricauda ochracea]NAY92244.1 hypothetical protein [Allomuricauda ochracea]